jgi:predicted dehydrogenase
MRAMKQSQQQRFLVIGLGSMGKRRIRNLLALKIKPENILGFDPQKARRDEVEKNYAVKTMDDFDVAVKTHQPTALIISTTPHLHAQYFLYAAKHGINFFVEATTTDEGYAKLKTLLNDKFVAAPSATFRYMPAVQKMKQIIEKGTIGKVLSFQYYLGQYLPDWHPYEDYRKVYFAQKSTGGGREMFPFELAWLNFIFGSTVEHAVGINTKISDLEMDADDVYATIVQYKNNITGTIDIDLLNRVAARKLRVIGSEGTLEWDWLAHEIKILKPKKKPLVIRLDQGKKFGKYLAAEDMYIAEMRDFVDAIKGTKKNPYTYEEDWDILKTLYKVEKSFTTFKSKKIW